MKKEFASKTQAIMYHLKHIGRLSQKECTELYGATRLGGIVFSKREQGFVIKTHDVFGKDRYGKKYKCAEYEFIQEPKSIMTKNKEVLVKQIAILKSKRIEKAVKQARAEAEFLDLDGLRPITGSGGKKKKGFMAGFTSWINGLIESNEKK